MCAVVCKILQMKALILSFYPSYDCFRTPYIKNNIITYNKYAEIWIDYYCKDYKALNRNKTERLAFSSIGKIFF